LGIKWIKEEALFAFIPKDKDLKARWLSRSISWKKENKQSTRTVVDVRMKYNNENEIKNMKCLAFRTKFENLDNEWFISINPDWVFLSPEFKVCRYEFKYTQYLKKMERNMHVFNHFNFILKYLQPSNLSLFAESYDYHFLTIGDIEKFDFNPIIPDNLWANLEELGNLAKLHNENADIGLFVL
jgi:hypothetical protein